MINLTVGTVIAPLNKDVPVLLTYVPLIKFASLILRPPCISVAAPICLPPQNSTYSQKEHPYVYTQHRLNTVHAPLVLCLTKNAGPILQSVYQVKVMTPLRTLEMIQYALELFYFFVSVEMIASKLQVLSDCVQTSTEFAFVFKFGVGHVVHNSIIVDTLGELP